MNTTLNAIRSHNPCTEGWKKLLAHLGKTKADDEPLSILTILDSNGLDDSLWCLRTVEGHDREIRLYVAWCARQVQHLMTDPRSVAAIDIAERFANGAATRDELVYAEAAEAAEADAWDAALVAEAAWDAAQTAAEDAEAVEAAAWAEARAAGVAWSAAWAAARAAGAVAWIAARDAARDAAWTAWDAARGAAWAAARDAQERRLREICLQEVSA